MGNWRLWLPVGLVCALGMAAHLQKVEVVDGFLLASGIEEPQRDQFSRLVVAGVAEEDISPVRSGKL